MCIKNINYKRFINSHLFVLLLSFWGAVGYAQLDSLHYMPPLRQSNVGTNLGNYSHESIKDQSIYLSTPEINDISVRVYIGNSSIAWKTVTLKQGQPAEITSIGNNLENIYGGLAERNNDITLLSDSRVGQVLSDAGLRFESEGGEKFYVNYRGRSGYQAASLTCKGTHALGKVFRWGGIPNITTQMSAGTCLGIMATEDGTTVTISGYNANCAFRNGTVGYYTGNTSMTITLNKGQSYVLEAPKNKTINGSSLSSTQQAANVDGWLGASIVSTKNIAVSCGGMNFGVSSAGPRDAGIDQIVPVSVLQNLSQVGEEGLDYVFVRANGRNNDGTEFAVIVATEDNTEIKVNGNTVTTIDNGEYYIVDWTNYQGASSGGSSPKAGQNMLVHTNKPSYAYQCLAAAGGKKQTVGMNYVAPVNCLLPRELIEIPEIKKIAGGNAQISAITIIASSTIEDEDIKVIDANGTFSLEALISFSHATKTAAYGGEWNSFYITDLEGEVQVKSTGAIAVGVFMTWGANGGLAGYFSGFDTAPEVEASISGGGCFPGGNLIEPTNDFNAYQWYFKAPEAAAYELLQDANTHVFDPHIKGVGRYYAEVSLSGCTYRSNIVHLYECCDAHSGNVDTDSDGIADICDQDDDNDGILDVVELCTGQTAAENPNYRVITIKINLDADEEETSWEIRNPNGVLLANGNNYHNSDNIIQQTVVADRNGDYVFTINDSGGNGFSNADEDNIANCFITVSNENGTVLFLDSLSNNYNFESSENITFQISAVTTDDFNCLSSDPSGDDDRDGTLNYLDADYLTNSPSNIIRDTDSDGTPDYLDLDSDGDDCPDAYEGGNNIDEEQIYHYGSGAKTWRLKGNVNEKGIPNIVVASGGQGLGNSTNASNNSNCPEVLPVELLSFEPERKGDDVLLKWRTEIEINNDYFTLYRSEDAQQWTEIAQVEGKGNSTLTQDYEYVDESPIYGLNYYRLEQTDYDGTEEKLLNCFIDMSDVGEEAIWKIYPNPIEDKLVLQGNLTEEKHYSILNALGVDVRSEITLSNVSDNQWVINVNKLPKGLYLIIVGEKTLKFIKK